MPQHENADQARAQRLFKTRELQKADAPKATADYYAAEQAVRDRTRELRRLRLARGADKRDLASEVKGPAIRVHRKGRTLGCNSLRERLGGERKPA